MLDSFSHWINRRRTKIPQADTVIPLIAQAGNEGMSRGAIGAAVKLDRDVLDELLDGLVRAGIVTVVVRDGVRGYRAV